MKKLNEDEIKELQACAHMPNGDEIYWDKCAEFYEGDKEASERISFMKGYLLSVKSIPLGYSSRMKTEKAYRDLVDEFNKEIGYVPEKEEFEDNLLEKIAAKFGINIDINGDGLTSFDKYRR